MAYATKEKRLAWLKEYRQRPEVKERIAQAKKRYNSKPEVKEKKREYDKRWRESHPNYRNREKHNEYNRVYHNNHKDYRARYRKEHLAEYASYAKEYRKKAIDIVKAHQAVRSEIRKGNLRRMPCEICKSLVTEAHHDDYSFPLVVRWLCKEHHMEWHRFNKAKH